MTLLVLGWKPRFEQILADVDDELIVVLGAAERAEYGAVTRSLRDSTVIDLADKADIGRLMLALKRLESSSRVGPITHVFTDQETPMVAASLLAQHFGARGVSLAAAISSKDKFLQKQALRAFGITVPEFRLVSGTAAQRAQALDGFRYPAVLKPVSAHGSRLVSVVPHAQAAADVLAAVEPGTPDVEAFVLEEVMQGTEMHADGLVADGEVVFLSVSRYHAHVLEARGRALIGSTVLEPVADASRYAAAQGLAQATATAMEHEAGAFHLEYFETARGLVFSECGARTGGTWVTDAVAAKFGVDLRRGALEAVLGRPISGLGEPGGKAVPVRETVCWSYLPAPAAAPTPTATPDERQARPLPSARELEKLPGVLRAHVAADAHTRTYPGRCGLLIVQGASAQEARARLAAAVEWFAAGCAHILGC
jgi:biotin carboxylase